MNELNPVVPEVSDDPVTLCKVEGCGEVAITQSMCSKHYQKWRMKMRESKPRCAAPATCKNIATKLGLCTMHHNQFVDMTHRERLENFGFDIVPERPRWEYPGREDELPEV